MSHLLWKYYWEQDVERFRRLLASTGQNSHPTSKSPALGTDGSYLGKSPGASGSSPMSSTKPRRASGLTPSGPAKGRESGTALGRAEINSRDYAGLTILLRASSSTEPHARDFARALIDHPAIDLYAQDLESGWNALHRALYSGNVSIARMLLLKERENLISRTSAVGKVGQLIKTKDNEGNSPFDVYNSTIATRSLRRMQELDASEADSESGDSAAELADPVDRHVRTINAPVRGDEVYVFGSNKNLSLGVGDEDDRQFPERIQLKRPDTLLHRLYADYCAEHDMDPPGMPVDLDEIPTLVRNARLVIKDMAMSKLHSAILTTDPICNLYVCGVGRGGRLGLGDQNTQFRYVPVQGPLADKKIQQVALGQNHTLAIAGNGELWTWGLNTDSQLGYVLPPPTRPDEEPMCVSPRQVFGSLKKENVLGVAASSIHSVAHTGSSLYCWGRNNGQLALMDSDSRSLDIQQTPRKVAASLLSAPIEMVSAIDRATTCLLSNHTVWVFTNYGYNLVKFPVPDVFSNFNMMASSSNHYEPDRKKIGYITSGDNTIAAVTARGDLFTMRVSQTGESSQPATSTTNPVKIKGALTHPDCIWDSRKDGAVSADVGEHGSVIICTESGAVWRRVKRSKGKTAAFSGADFKRKNFKFERVPYITGCVAARSSIFGAFAAIREESKVMSMEIQAQSQKLWEDVGSLLCLADFEAPGAKEGGEDRTKWNKAIAGVGKDSVPYAILQSADIEMDLQQWLASNSFLYESADMEIRTSVVPDVRIPVHSFLLAGRSSVLRSAFAEFRDHGALLNQEHMVMEAGSNPCLTLMNVDIYTLLNIVVYMYHDAIVPVWKYTRESPSQAHRFRQVRSELMKVSTRLDLPKLEASARLQIGVEQSMDKDLQRAIRDPLYVEDGDVIIELDGSEATAHSQLLCQRCPFFEGLFQGRSRGQWLAARRDGLEDGEKLRIDLGHVHPDTFRYVLAYLYGDVGPEMFEDVTAPGLDEFSEIVLDVMAVANELMLDRLSQICQLVIGKFVTTRNISNLLNEISPCSVTDFKDTGLEYICLQLESMLENHLLENLDEDLLHELDDVVRDNQLARFPFARSGRTELVLNEKYPDLALDVEEERRVRVRELAYRASQREDERKLSSSYKARAGSLDGFTGISPTAERSRRKPKPGRNEPFSPSLRPKTSATDLLFAMDDDPTTTSSPGSPELSAAVDRLDLDAEPMPQLPKSWQQRKDRIPHSLDGLVGVEPTPPSPRQPEAFPSRPSAGSKSGSGTNSPWAATDFPKSKMDLRNIMTETNTSKSSLSAGLAAAQTNKSPGVAAAAASAASRLPQAKMSQKERKKQMQLQAEAEAAEQEGKAKATPWEKVHPDGRPAPWKAPTAAPAPPKTPLKEALAPAPSPAAVQKGPVAAGAKPLVASETGARPSKVRTASPDTRFPGQGRAVSSSSAPGQQRPKDTPLVPHSRSYLTPARKTEELAGSSMADIIGQQKREQERAREAVAKRSLQEIQQEQEFQEWWDQESRRAQEEESGRRQSKGGVGGGSGGSGKRQQDSAQRGRRGRGGAPGVPAAATSGDADSGGGGGGGGGGPSSSRGGHRGRGGRGRGRRAK